MQQLRLVHGTYRFAPIDNLITHIFTKHYTQSICSITQKTVEAKRITEKRTHQANKNGKKRVHKSTELKSREIFSCMDRSYSKRTKKNSFVRKPLKVAILSRSEVRQQSQQPGKKVSSFSARIEKHHSQFYFYVSSSHLNSLNFIFAMCKSLRPRERATARDRESVGMNKSYSVETRDLEPQYTQHGNNRPKTDNISAFVDDGAVVASATTAFCCQ